MSQSVKEINFRKHFLITNLWIEQHSHPENTANHLMRKCQSLKLHRITLALFECEDVPR